MKPFIIASILILMTACNKSNKTIQSKSEGGPTDMELAHQRNISSNELLTGWYETTITNTTFKRTDKHLNTQFSLNPKPIVIADNFIRILENPHEEQKQIYTIHFNSRGAKAWYQATSRNIGKHLVFILNDEIIGTLIVNAPGSAGICTVQIDNLNKKQLKNLLALSEK